MRPCNGLSVGGSKVGEKPKKRRKWFEKEKNLHINKKSTYIEKKRERERKRKKKICTYIKKNYS